MDASSSWSVMSFLPFAFVTVAAVFQVAIWAREIILGMIERRASGSDDAGSETLANAMSLPRAEYRDITVPKSICGGEGAWGGP